MAGLVRIIWHWTAGADGIIPVEADAYHFIVGRDGRVYEGWDKPEANIPPLVAGKYAAHTLNCNSGSIGVSLDAMADAQERPFSAGRFPITDVQIEALVKLTASLCVKYGIPVTRQTVLSHAEVQATLGITQKNKWDIAWLPGMEKPGDPLKIGDELRARVIKAMAKPDVPAPPPPAPKRSLIDRLWPSWV